MKYWGMLLIALFAVTAFAGPRRMAQRRFDVVGRYASVASAYQYPTGLVAYWSMDSRSGTTVYDTAGSNNGTAVDSPLFGPSYGKYLDGVDLNGSSQYINVGNPPVNFANGLSISAWVKPDSLDLALNMIYSKAMDNENATYYLAYYKSSSAIWFLVRISGVNYIALNTNSVPISGWSHIAATYGLEGMHVYINGVSGLKKSAPFDFGFINNENAAIGRMGTYNGYHWDGAIDEVAIWDRALSSNEVSEIYNNGAGRFYTP